MSTPARPCTIALDLGTSAFKAAWVDGAGNLGPVVSVRVWLDYEGGGVTCPPERYMRAALRALREARADAGKHGLHPTALGITSQAQTFITLKDDGRPAGPAVVWTDARAAVEAEEAASALPDFAVTGGFTRPSPLQFLPKVMHARRTGGSGRRYLLLNEWLLHRLTGEAFGDTNSQGMGGFWDIVANAWSGRALELAGVTPESLARVGPAGSLSAPLSVWARRATGLPALPAYSCGNDQSCAAVGAGVEGPGDLFCNFGTAMVVYGFSRRPLVPAGDSQLTGVGPLPGLHFLLGVESECGNVLEALAARLYPAGGVGRLVAEALAEGVEARGLPPARIVEGRADLTGVLPGTDPAAVARAVLEVYSARFGELLAGVERSLGRPGKIFAGGGLSKSRAWLKLLERRHGVRLRTCGTEHPGLRGVATVIQRGREARGGAPV